MLKPMGVLAVAVCFAAGMQPANAQSTCATKIIRATGGPAILEGPARSKARSAWIRRVSTKRTLGKSYAVWLRAKDQAYNCRMMGKWHVCSAAATPCRI